MKFYQLNIDTDYIIDDFKVAYFHSCTELKEDLAYTVWSDKFKEISGKIYFSADFRLCNQLSYLCNDIDIPIISNKIIDLIDETYKSLYQFHPVILFDGEHMSPFENGKIKPDVNIIEDFSIISFTEKIDVIDYQRSHVYKEKDVISDKVFTYVRPLIFKEEMSTPPIFKIPFNPISIYITEDFKNKLESINALGFSFEKVKN